MSIQESLTPKHDLLSHTDQHIPCPMADDPVTNYILNNDTTDQILLAFSCVSDQEAINTNTFDTRPPVVITSLGVNNTNPWWMDGPVQAASSSSLENNGHTKDNHANEHTMKTKQPPGVAISDWPQLPTTTRPATQIVSSASGWIQQRVSAIKPAITQQLYNLFPAMHFPYTTANLGEDSSPLGQIWTSDIFLNHQPRHSIAFFPAALPSQPELKISVYTGSVPRHQRTTGQLTSQGMVRSAGKYNSPSQHCSTNGPLSSSVSMMHPRNLHSLPVPPWCSQQLVSPEMSIQESLTPTLQYIRGPRKKFILRFG